MSFLGNSAFPRNTSNGDYGRFHFVPEIMKGGGGAPSNLQYSTDGNRMIQHVHYPNCPHNRQSGANAQQGGGNQGQAMPEGMPEYTIEYGEDAVRKALGGNMPDFQAQFQQQYGNGNIGDGDGFKISPQQMQMMNNGGKSKIAMVPVILTSDDQGNVQEEQCQEQNAQPELQGQDSTVGGENPQNTEAAEGQAETQKCPVPKPVNVINAMNSVRSSRSTGAVKYGRHIRPSYYNPQVPNPCRRKFGPGGDGAKEDCPPAEANQNQTFAPANTPEVTDPLDYYYQQYGGGIPNANANQEPVMTMSLGNVSGPVKTPPIQRTRSLPPKKQSASLCGKCTKCRNLSSVTESAPILTFPKYSSGKMNLNPHQKLNTSSNLAQSAKNFRAIRFSSNHPHSFNFNK